MVRWLRIPIQMVVDHPGSKISPILKCKTSKRVIPSPPPASQVKPIIGALRDSFVYKNESCFLLTNG